MVELDPSLNSPKPEKAAPPYSAIVIIPYTSRVQGVYGGDKIIGDPLHPRKARIRLSSFSALVTAAAEILHEKGASEHIVALGENTFGEEHQSTADLMKEQLVKKDVPGDAVIPLGNLQDTDEQLVALRQQDPTLLTNPLYIPMEFHEERVRMVLSKHNLPGTIKSAEDVFMDHFKEKYSDLKEEDPTKYAQVLQRHRQQLRQFTPRRVRLAESVFKSATKLGPLGEILLKGLRKARGGQTITDYSSLTSAKKHLEGAKKGIREGKLKPAESQKIGITSEDDIFSEVKAYRNVLRRILEETDYFRDIQELGLLEVLENLSGSHKINGSDINWGVFNIAYMLVDTAPEFKPHGRFDAVGKKVNIYFKRPTAKDVLRSILHGTMPEAIIGLLHEGTHAFQFPNRPITRAEHKDVYRKNGALHEAQAFRTALDYRSWANTTTNDLIRLVSSIHSRFGAEQIEYSCRAIDQLTALGFSHVEIGQLIQEEEGWSMENSAFPHIAAAIEATKKEKGITTDEQMDGLLEKEAWRKRIERQKAIDITRAELQRI